MEPRSGGFWKSVVRVLTRGLPTIGPPLPSTLGSYWRTQSLLQAAFGGAATVAPSDAVGSSLGRNGDLVGTELFRSVTVSLRRK